MTILIITLLAVTGLVVHPSDDFLITYTNPLLLEFALGCVVAINVQRIKISSSRAVLLAVIAMLLLVIGLIEPFKDLARPVKWGIPCAMILVCALSLESHFASKIFQPLIILGNSSYSLYLTHPFTQGGTITAFNRIAHFLPLSPLVYDICLIFTLVWTSVAVGLLFFYQVEDRITRSFSSKRVRSTYVPVL